jgi:glutathione peroxidase
LYSTLKKITLGENMMLWPYLLVTLGLKDPAAYANPQTSFFELKAENLDNKPISFSDYKGKVILVVNVASRCGFTPQYKDLQALYLEYKDQGLEILGFPSNDFAEQEPGNAEDIKKFCSLNYSVTFPLFKKGPVKGSDKQPVYKWLTEEANSSLNGGVHWNFEKFL